MSPALRLLPPSELTDGGWVGEHVLARKRYRLSAEAAAALVMASAARDHESLCAALAAADPKGGDAEAWADTVGALQRKGLLVDATSVSGDPDLAWMVQTREQWSRHGWHEAFEYQALTYDYPCLDYAADDAVAVDQGRMRRYQGQESDDDRYKLTYVDRPGVPLPEPAEVAGTAGVDHVLTGAVPPAALTFETLSAALALAFAVTGLRFPVTDAAPLLRKTSPSGGGRHPTEGYVVAIDVPGLDPGCYHVTTSPPSLRRIRDLPQLSAITDAFPETVHRFPGPVSAICVLTTMFARNMYRYREPRTLRTVFMDAGHVAGTLRIAAHSLGAAAGVYYCDNASAAELLLGLDGMGEGYMVTVGIGDGDGDTAAATTAASVEEHG